MKRKLAIGDNVRITKKNKTFDNGYTQRWTEEVSKFLKFNWPVTYKITDDNGDKIQCLFYEQELH